LFTWQLNLRIYTTLSDFISDIYVDGLYISVKLKFEKSSVVTYLL